MFLVTAALIIQVHLIIFASSSPALPSSNNASPKYYEPAEPNYEPITEKLRSMALPASDEEASMLDELSRPHETDYDESTRNVQGGIFARVSVHDDDDGSVASVFKKGPSGGARPGTWLPTADEFVVSFPMTSIENNKPRSVVPALTKSSTRVSAYPPGGDPIADPAKYYLKGAQLNNVTTPKCHMIGCDGPFPDDGNLYVDRVTSKPAETCHQAFVPLNGCVGEKGYPVGVVCTICCDCTKSFIQEMRKSRGYIHGFNGN